MSKIQPRSKVQIRNRRADSRISGEVRRLDDLRAADILRLDDLRQMERHYRAKLDKVRGKNQRAIAKTEKGRIDALLAADRANVGIAAARAEIVATNLQERVETTAKAAAIQTETSAAALRGANEAAITSVENRITPLEQAGWGTLGGKSQRVEDRQSFRWTTERVMVAIGFALGALYFILQNTPALK